MRVKSNSGRGAGALSICSSAFGHLPDDRRKHCRADLSFSTNFFVGQAPALSCAGRQKGHSSSSRYDNSQVVCLAYHAIPPCSPAPVKETFTRCLLQPMSRSHAALKSLAPAIDPASQHAEGVLLSKSIYSVIGGGDEAFSVGK